MAEPTKYWTEGANHLSGEIIHLASLAKYLVADEKYLSDHATQWQAFANYLSWLAK